jgi:NitT/TauT family transport system permease protein/sulfonate transport system permease protein
MKKSSFWESRWAKPICALISILVFLTVWHLGVTHTGLGRLMPGPLDVIGRFISSFSTNIGQYTILGHVLWSLSRVLVAYTVACTAGVVCGLAMGRYPKFEAAFRPYFEIIRPIPPIAWIPMAILWFGLGELTKYFLIFLACFANVTLNAYTGAISVDPELIGAARMLGANDNKIFRSITIPASVPHIFAGMQIALSSSWATVVAAEMVRSSEGIGWMIVSGMEINNMTQILAGIVAIGIVGYALATFMRFMERKLLVWNERGA